MKTPLKFRPPFVIKHELPGGRVSRQDSNNIINEQLHEEADFDGRLNSLLKIIEGLKSDAQEITPSDWKGLWRKFNNIKIDMARYGADLISSLEEKKEKIEQELKILD